MLEIGVDGAEDLAAGDLPAADYGDGEAAFVLAADDAQLGEVGAEARRRFPRCGRRCRRRRR